MCAMKQAACWRCYTVRASWHNILLARRRVFPGGAGDNRPETQNSRRHRSGERPPMTEATAEQIERDFVEARRRKPAPALRVLGARHQSRL